MKGLLTRRQARRAERSFTAFARHAKKAEAGVGQMMREMRSTGAAWLAAIETLERDNPAEAARLPRGTKGFCKTIIERSADAELAIGDTLGAVRAVHESIRSLEQTEQRA